MSNIGLHDRIFKANNCSFRTAVNNMKGNK